MGSRTSTRRTPGKLPDDTLPVYSIFANNPRFGYPQLFANDRFWAGKREWQPLSTPEMSFQDLARPKEKAALKDG